MSKYGIICGPYLPAFGLNADQKWLGIWTLFTQCLLCNMRKRRKAWVNSGHWKCFLYKVRAVECAIFSFSEVSPLQLYNDFCKKSHLKRTLFMKDFQASYNVLLFDKTLMYHSNSSCAIICLQKRAVKNAVSSAFQVLLFRHELSQYLGDKFESFHSSSVTKSLTVRQFSYRYIIFMGLWTFVWKFFAPRFTVMEGFKVKPNTRFSDNVHLYLFFNHSIYSQN